ncbi:MAG: exo-beta-N-acetylmuramidase NamZ domain-containing protein [Bacteroidales bacterium]
MLNLTTISIIVFVGILSCSSNSVSNEGIVTGAEQVSEYTSELQGKNVAVVANHTSLVDSVHLVDTMLTEEIHVKRIFSPEHGFRGEAGAGENVRSYRDEKTGLPVVSLYGSRKKPKHEHLEDVDVVVFDIQDVGVRFYTYISTMHYMMEVCAETGTKFMVLDRPNPNGFYVDGPMLDSEFRSFVGMHPIPVVHGMTIAELARMINNEGWLEDGIRCDYEWIPCKNYTHDSLYKLPVKPSPNLPNMRSIYLYPSLCLFEGTVVSVGRGTDFPFQVFGHPEMENAPMEFTPRSIPGASQNPQYKGQRCHGIDLRKYPLDSLLNNPRFRLSWLKFAYKNTRVDDFFTSYFTKLSGSDKLLEQFKEGIPISDIRAGWKSDLKQFMNKRKQYLIYEDFTEKRIGK